MGNPFSRCAATGKFTPWLFHMTARAQWTSGLVTVSSTGTGINVPPPAYNG